MDMIIFESLPIEVRGQILTALCEHSEEGIFILDHQFCFKWVNLSYENIVGYSLRELEGQPISNYPFSELKTCSQSLLDSAKTALNENQFFQQQVSYLTCYDTYFTTNLSIWSVTHYSETYYVGLLREISAAKQTSLAHQQAISYNPITTLPNPKQFITKLNNLIYEGKQELAMVILSIDKFKMISNTLDKLDRNNLLKQITMRLQSIPMSGLNLFSHFDADNFVLVFETADKNMVLTELNKIVKTCKSPFAISKHKFYINYSMGVSVFPDHGRHIDHLSRSAEIALQVIKTQGGNGIGWYNEQMNQKTLKQLKLEAQLHKAFKYSQFIPYYQPKIDLKTGQFVGFEALVRWNHPEQGLLNASQFMKTIIENHLTFNLFQAMANTAIVHLNSWLIEGYECSVCLNVDAAEFRHPNFVNYLKYLLTLYPRCQSYLHIEITETSLIINDEDAANTLDQLKNLGISIALDDFGTGYSSLSYLQHYDFDYVKIDRSFVNDLHFEPKNFAIVKAIILMAHSMNMQVIAEGIECREQIDTLNSIDCDFGQGYFIGKPLSSIQATQLLIESSSNVNAS